MTHKNKSQETNVVKSENQKNENEIKPICGIIMPIAGTEHYPASHWEEVKKNYYLCGYRCGIQC